MAFLRSPVLLLGSTAGLAPLTAAQSFGFVHQMVPAGAESTAAVTLGDVDGDGDLDALVGNSGLFPGTQNRLHLNLGAGVFADVTGTNLPVQIGNCPAVALGDLDGDGDLDAFIGTTGQDRLYLNGGAGAFTDATAASLPPVVDDTAAVAFGDVDGDGDLDAFVGNSGFPGQQDRLYLNGGTGAFTDATAMNLPALLNPTSAVSLGDVDGDGDLDAFIGNFFPGPGTFPVNRLYLNGGSGAFTDASATSLPPLLFLGDDTRAVMLGDVDGDGDLDAFAGNYAQPSRLYLNGGTGVYADVTATNLPYLVDLTQAASLGDVDGDGDLDALLGNGGFSPFSVNRLLLNAGAGVFSAAAAANLPDLPTSTAALALGDVDGDGDLDALVGNVSRQDRLYLNEGTGVFADVTATSLPVDEDYTRAVALGDVDGDGDADAITVNPAPSPTFVPPRIRLHLNVGNGTFIDGAGPILPPVAGYPGSIALGDLDGDGDLDAYLGEGYQDRLYLNGGAGTFTDVTATNLPAVSDPTAAVALGDVDGDGDLDALIGNVGLFTPAQNRLHLNNGSAVFSDVTVQLPSLLDDTYAVAFGDVDADGDLDALVGNFG